MINVYVNFNPRVITLKKIKNQVVLIGRGQQK